MTSCRNQYLVNSRKDKDLVLYSLGEEVIANARRIVIIDNDFLSVSEFGHGKRRKESWSHRRRSGREGNRSKDGAEAGKKIVVVLIGYKKEWRISPLRLLREW